MVSRPFILGFHGCDRAVADRIISGQTELLRSNRPWDWLGHGIYFWEDSPARARRWARDHAGRQITIPAVIGAVIDLGNCLNLIDAEALRLVKVAHDAYRNICRASGMQAARNRGGARFLDCAVIETLHRLRAEQGLAPFATVRGFFMEGTELHPEAGFRELDRVQVCVRSPGQVLGYFHPRNTAI